MVMLIRLRIYLIGIGLINILILNGQHINLEKNLKFNYDGIYNFIPKITINSNTYSLSSRSEFNLATTEELKRVSVTGGIENVDEQYKCTFNYNKYFDETPLTDQELQVDPITVYGTCSSGSISIQVSLHRVNNTIARTELPTKYSFNESVPFIDNSFNFDSNLSEKLHLEFTAEGTTSPVLASFELSVAAKNFKLSDHITDTAILSKLIGKNLTMHVSYCSNIVTYNQSDKKTFTIMFTDQVDLEGSVASRNVTFEHVKCKGGNGSINFSKLNLASKIVVSDLTKFRYVISQRLSNNDWKAVAPTSVENPDTSATNTGGMILSASTELLAGHYRLKVWAQDIAVGWVEFDITEPVSDLAATSTSTDPVCSTGNGSISVITNGGTPNYTITVDNSNAQTAGAGIQKDFSNISIGSHNVKVIDANGCIYSTAVTINAGTDPQISLVTSLPACSQHPDGTIKCNVNNVIHEESQSNYTYYLNGESKTYPFTVQANIEYDVKIIDNRGCSSNTIENVILSYDTSNDPVIEFGTIVQPKCSDKKTGSIEVKVKSGGHGTAPIPFTYYCTGKNNVQNQGTSYTFSGMDKGSNYTVFVTDELGCPSSSLNISLAYTNTVSVEGVPVVKTSIAGTEYHLICSGDINGEININASSSPANLFLNNSLLFDNNLSPILNKYNAANEKFEGLTVGKYYIQVFDEEGCSQLSNEIELKEPSEVTFIGSSVQSTNVTCHGGNNGSIIIGSVIGGSGSYKYSFNNEIDFSDSNTKNDCSAKDYYLKAKDDQGCISPAIIRTISEPPLLLLDTSLLYYHGNNHVSCNSASDGRIDMEISGGTGNYQIGLYHDSYTTKINSQENIIPASPSKVSFNNLGINSYKIKVTDANLCTSEKTVILDKKPSILTASASPETKSGSVHHISCKGYSDGKITITIEGGTDPYTVYLKNLNDNTEQHKVFLSGAGSFDNLKAGSYAFYVEDVNSCRYPDDGYESIANLTEPDAITITWPVAEAVNNGYYIRCFGGQTNLNPTINGGNGTYRYTWSDGQSSAEVTGLIAGKYKLSVTDRLGCPPGIDSIILNQPEELYFSEPFITKPTCAYNSDGVISISALGGVAPYSFSIGSEIKSTVPAIFTDKSDGQFRIDLIDDNGCPRDTTISIENYPALTSSVIQNPGPHCYGGNDGIIELSGTAGNPFKNGSYIFNLYKGSASLASLKGTTALFKDNLNAGEYLTTIIDSFGCEFNLPVNLEEAKRIEYLLVKIDNQCFNDNTAELKVKATNGYGDFMYGYRFDKDTMNYTLKADSTLTLTRLNWNRYNTDTLLRYHFYIRDKNYTEGQPCTLHDSTTFKEVKKIKPQIITDSITCFGANDGVMRVNQVENAILPVTYSWKGQAEIENNTGSSIENLGPGTYTVTVKDEHQCEYSHTEKIDNPFPIVVEVIHTFADSIHNGKAILRISGTSDTVTYWLDGFPYTGVLQNKELTIESLSAGNYAITVADPDNLTCTASATFAIHHLPPVLKLIGQLPATFGNSDGSISVEATGKSDIFYYFWLNESGDTIRRNTTGLVTDLEKGKYFILSKDQDGLKSNTIIHDIMENDSLALSKFSDKNPTCRVSKDGHAKVFAGGGSRPFTFWWTNSEGTIISTDSIISDVQEGIYTAHVKDSRSIEKELTVKLQATDTIRGINTIVYSPKCHDQNSGQIYISNVLGGSGSYSYLWSTGFTNRNLTDLGLGSYSVKVFDNTAPDQACYFEKEIIIGQQPDQLTILTDSIIQPVCVGGNNGKIFVSGKGGRGPYSFEWSGTGVTGRALYNAAAGEYAVKIRDSNGCETMDTVTVDNPEPLQFLSAISSPKCAGESNGSISIQMLNGRPGYMARWSPNLLSNSLNVNVAAGSYSVEITDANNCKVTGSFVVNEPGKLNIDSFVYTSPKCSNSNNGSIKAYVSGGTSPYYYRWSDYQKSQETRNLPAGTYSLSVTDYNLCKTTASAILKAPEPVSFSFSLTEPSCSGYIDGEISISPSGGTGKYSYLLNGKESGQNITGISAGTYTVKMSDENNCAVTRNILLNQPSPLIVSDSVLSLVKCAGENNGHVRLNVSGSFAPYTASWTDGGNGFERSDLYARRYDILISDQHNCKFNKVVRMSEPAPLSIRDYSYVEPSCKGYSNGSISVTPAGGIPPYQISWNNAQKGNSVQNIGAGNYVVSVTDRNNCLYSRTLELTEPAKVSIRPIPDKFQLCEGQENLINPGNWSAYSWYFNEKRVSGTTIYNANKQGHYSLKVVSPMGCTDSTNFDVQVSKDLLSADFLLPHDAVTGDTVEIIDISWPVPDSISWYINTSDTRIVSTLHDRQRVVFSNPGEYTVTLTARKALCLSKNNQNIIVYNTINEKLEGKQPVAPQGDIEELYLYPNPNNGSFTVKIKLSQPGYVKLQVLRMAENRVLALKEGDNSDLYEYDIDMPGITQGVYVLTVQTRNDARSVKFIVIK